MLRAKLKTRDFSSEGSSRRVCRATTRRVARGSADACFSIEQTRNAASSVPPHEYRVTRLFAPHAASDARLSLPAHAAVQVSAPREAYARRCRVIRRYAYGATRARRSVFSERRRRAYAARFCHAARARTARHARHFFRQAWPICVTCFTPSHAAAVTAPAAPPLFTPAPRRFFAAVFGAQPKTRCRTADAPPRTMLVRRPPPATVAYATLHGRPSTAAHLRRWCSIPARHRAVPDTCRPAAVSPTSRGPFSFPISSPAICSRSAATPGFSVYARRACTGTVSTRDNQSRPLKGECRAYAGINCRQPIINSMLRAHKASSARPRTHHEVGSSPTAPTPPCQRCRHYFGDFSLVRHAA